MGSNISKKKYRKKTMKQPETEKTFCLCQSCEEEILQKDFCINLWQNNSDFNIETWKGYKICRNKNCSRYNPDK